MGKRFAYLSVLACINISSAIAQIQPRDLSTLPRNNQLPPVMAPNTPKDAVLPRVPVGPYQNSQVIPVAPSTNSQLSAILDVVRKQTEAIKKLSEDVKTLEVKVQNLEGKNK